MTAKKTAVAAVPEQDVPVEDWRTKALANAESIDDVATARGRNGRENPYLDLVSNAWDNDQGFSFVVPEGVGHAKEVELARRAAKKLGLGIDSGHQAHDSGGVEVHIKPRVKRERRSPVKADTTGSEDTVDFG